MANNYHLLDVMKAMKNAVSGISQHIYANDRPKSVPTPQNDFIVVNMPVMVYDKMVGTGFDLKSSFVRFEIYVKDVNGLENTVKLSSMAQQVLDKIPLNSGVTHLSDARVVFKGTDGHGFHTAWVQCSLLIY